MPLADLDPVDVRQHQVEHDQRRRVRGGLADRVRAVRRRPHGVPGVAQVERDEGGDRAFVLDDQDGRDGGGHAQEPLPKESLVAPLAASCSGLPPLTENEPSSGVPKPWPTIVPLPTAEALMSDAISWTV